MEKIESTNMTIFGEESENNLSLIKDPFNLSCVHEITIKMMDCFGEKRFYGWVDFRNENTRGSQEIKGKDLADVYYKVYEFCKSLNK